ncbi:MAG: hypothetical protein VX346_13545 [Planctomycetota bacterium]|nr:hypothetical protein [Planctomycetota bacterium]
MLAILAWMIFTESGRTQDTSSTFVQRQQQAQQLATQLVSGTLDLQLRQLQENGLEHLPVYAEIKSMRRNIYELVDREMRHVVEQLTQADLATGKPQELLRQQARAEIRQIVVRLMAERQKLEQRLQVSRLSAQVRQLLNLQRRVQQATQSLSEQDNARRQQLAVTAIADQSDVIAVFEDLLGALAQVRSWGGPRSGAALEGLQLLRAGDAGEILQHIVTAMQQADFETAAGQQTTALQIFHTLLQRLDRDRGVDGAQRTALLKQIRALILLQESLREETRAAATAELSSDNLVERQSAVHQAITGIGSTSADFTAVKPLWQQAETAAFDAVEDLFSESKAAALAEQATVIGSLAQLADHLQQSNSDGHSEKSAHELSLEIRRLETLAKALNEATAAHQQWSRRALDETEAGAQKATVPYAVPLPPLPDATPTNSTAPLPITVAAALQNAQDQAAALGRATSPPNPVHGQTLQNSVQQVEVAIRQTQAEVQSYLTDLRRRHLSVEVGEVARAAESLERAAAAERILARGAPLTINQSEQQTEQQRITSVAEDIARGVENSAPQVSAQLKALTPALTAATQQSPPAPAAGTASSATHHAARPALTPLAASLTSAAAALRRHQDQVATQLAELAASQTGQLQNARATLEKELPRLNESQQTPGASLQQAQRAVFAARVEQLRASGHRAAAQALATSGKIAALQRQQRRLGFEHLDAFTTWSDLAIEQRQVTRMLEELKDSSPPAISTTIAEATQASTQAARMALSANRRGYRSEHQRTMTTLSALQRELEALVEEHSQPLSAQFDLSAQLKVATHATTARASILNLLPEVVQVLQEIEARARLTGQAIRDGQESTTHSLQKANIQELLTAERALQEAILKTGQQEIAGWAPLSRRIQKLAARAAAIDAPATAALNQTLEAIQEGQGQSPQDLEHLAARQNSIQRGIDRAAASLAARETRVRRDQQVAESLAAMARDQQAAREDIEQYASRLNSMLAGNRNQDDEHTAEITPEQTKVAADLAAATQRFAATQRSTGEGAVQISGQQQVANRAIRRGLATASRLRSASWSRSSSTQQRQANAESPESPADGSTDGQPTATSSGNKAGDPTQTSQKNPANASAATKDGAPSGDAAESLQGLGTGLIPDSPETTAQQIAGPQASEAVTRAQTGRSSADATRGEASSRQASTSTGERATEEAQRPSAAQAGEAQAGQPGAARASLPGKPNPQQATAAEATAAAAEKRLERAPWFAKLPPQLREALRSRPRREAPRGYRERLRRYFQSID